jgi:hypothetical protein
MRLKKKTGKGWMEVLVKDVSQEVNRGSVCAGVRARSVRIDEMIF